MAKSQNKPRKRANGEGSLYFDKTRCVHVYAYHDDLGIRHTVSSKSEAQVKIKIRALKDQKKAGTLPNKVTLEQWAREWLEVYKKGNVSDATYEKTYEPTIRLHIIPELGFRELQDIKPVEMQKYFKGKTGCTDSHIHKIKTTLKQLFDMAVENDIIKKNPMRKAKIPRAKAPKKRESYTERQKETIIKFARTHKEGAPIIIFLETGLRIGEFLALSPQRIDLRRQILYVTQALKSKKGTFFVGPPKSEASYRAIPFGREAKNAFIRIHHTPLLGLTVKMINKTFVAITPVPSSCNREFVYMNTRGSFVNPRNYRKRRYDVFFEDLNEYLQEKKQAPIKRLPPHCLRHTYATLLRKTGVDTLTIARLLGHSKSQITEKVYIGNDVEVLRERAKIK